LKSIFQNKWAVIGFAMVCSFLWGSAFPVLKISNQELQMAPDDPIAQIVFAGIRFLLAGLILLVFLLFKNRKQLYVKRSHILILRKYLECRVPFYHPAEPFLPCYWHTFFIKMTK
jgi:drug/metabolite transporter (DMT)-like permease